MAIFGNRSQDRQDDSAYVTKAESAQFLEDFYALSERVTVLEGLARQIQSGGVPQRYMDARSVRESVARDNRDAAQHSYDRSGMPAAARGEQAPAGRTASVQGPSQAASGVDYGAVAFGLSEIKRKVATALGGAPGLTNEYAGAVQYFADVFAKSDPSFNADEFKRQAGV